MHTLLEAAKIRPDSSIHLGSHGHSPDADQARRFLQQLDMEMLLEVSMYRRRSQLARDHTRAGRLQAMDVERPRWAALCKGIRARYPNGRGWSMAMVVTRT